MGEVSELARALRDDYPAVDVTTVVFSRDFAGIGCCVIPQEKVLEIAVALEGHDALAKALEEIQRLSKPGQTIYLTQAIDILTDIWNGTRKALAKVSANG